MTQLATRPKGPLAAPAAPHISDVRTGAREILGHLSDLDPDTAARRAKEELWNRAGESGQTLTAYLESIDPTSGYPTSDALSTLDAFERQLAFAGIRTRSDPVKGIYADTVDRFYLSDQPASIVLFPEFINRQVRVTQLVPNILDDIIAITTPVDSDSYRTIYLQDTVPMRRMRRVTELAELPSVKVVTSEKAISLKKYGLRIIGSYEAFRRMRIDLFSLHLARVALQTMLDKSSDALDTGINGDGNTNPCTNYNLTTLDTGTTASNLTYKAWLRWNMKPYPYQLTSVVAGEAEMLSILTLQFPNINPMTLLAMMQNNGPIDARVEMGPGLFGTVKLIYFPLAPANILFGINKMTALEMVQEIGSTLTETDRIISRQYNEITISEVVGFGQIISNAIETMTLNA